MGNSSSSVVGYRELRSSLPGSLVHEEDFQLFYSLCKVESARTMSSVLYPSPTQLFFVVISGEILVQLSNKEVKPTTATAFSVGETIHFFNATLRGGSTIFSLEYSDAGECLRNGDIKLALHFRNVGKATAKVIGIDRRGFDEFMIRAKSNTHAVASFLNMSMVELFNTSPFCRTLTAEQANVYGPLLKIRLAHAGKEVGPHIAPYPMRAAEPKAKKVAEGTSTYSRPASGHVCMLLHGAMLSVPYKSNMQQLLNQILHRESTPVSASAPSSSLMPHFKFRSPAVVPLNVSPAHTPKVYHLTEVEQRAKMGSESLERNNDSGRGRSHVVMQPGSMVGNDQFLMRNPSIRIRTVLTTAPSVLGFAGFEAMDVLFKVDPRFKRVYERNYFMLLIAWVKYSVPFLMDMDEWSLALLSCKLNLIGVEAGGVIKRRGDKGEHAYILLGGGAKIQANPTAVEGQAGSGSSVVQEESEIKWGALLGVVALTTNQPYFFTVVATEPTMLIQLSKRVLDQIYYNNKAKLCEIRIRLMGTNVDLLHAIDHPRGGELFLEYLTWERAAENLHFYRAVDKYDAMCKDVRKQYAQIQKVLQQLADEELEASIADAAEKGALDAAEQDHSGDTIAYRQLALKAAGESNPTSPQPGTPEPSSPGQVTPDNHSAFENSMKQSPLKRLDPIMSASNIDPSSKSADGSARAGPIMNESEQDGPKEYAVKVKPAVCCLQPRQSSFSGRVALALTEDETDDKTDMSDNDTTTKLTMQPPSATADPGCAIGTEKLTHSASATKAPEEVDSPKDAAAVAALLVTDQSAAKVQTGATENTLGARKGRHRSSFLQAKSEHMDRAHEFYERQEPPGKGDEAGEGKESSTDAPSLAVQRSRAAKKIMRLTNTLRTQVVELNESARVIMQSYIYNDACQQLNLPDAMRIRCERQFSQWCTDLAQAPRGGDISTIPSSDALELLPSSTGVTPKGYSSTQASFSAPVAKLSAHHGSVHSTNFRNVYGGGHVSAADVRTQSEDTFQTTNTANSSSVQLDTSVHSSPHVVYQIATTTPSNGLARPESVNADGIASSGKPLAVAQSEAQIAPIQPPQQLSILSPHTAAAMSAVDIDLSFIDLFKEIKNEILKLLRDDKFPRWKATQEFQKFIASIKPYDNTTVSPAFFDTRQKLKERNLDRQASFESPGGSA